MTKLERTNDEKATTRFFSSFGFCQSFVIRHWSFVILLTPLSLQVASVSCAIWQSPSSSRQFAPSSSAGRKPDRLLWSAWGLSSVSLQFLSHRLPLFLRSLP